MARDVDLDLSVIVSALRFVEGIGCGHGGSEVLDEQIVALATLGLRLVSSTMALNSEGKSSRLVSNPHGRWCRSHQDIKMAYVKS